MVETKLTTVSGIETELRAGGEGQPLLFLHGGLGLERHEVFLDALAEDFRVLAPALPGFGKTAWPREVRTMGDLACFVLDLGETEACEDAILIGSGFGGWLALDLLVRGAARFSRAVLVDALGVKFGDRLTRDITDIHARDEAEMQRLLFHDPAALARDPSAMSDDELTAIVRAREAFAFFGWKPYMHDPSLRRWLHRVKLPTLVVWGASDGFVGPDYGRALASAIPGAGFEVIPEAGHYPPIEQPEALARLIRGFAAGGAEAAA